MTDAEALDVGRIFSSRLTYNKGAMVANMLRFKLGDTAFFQGLQSYLNAPNLAYAYAVTSDLESQLELTSGVNLDEFFNDWIYKQGYPTYDIIAQNLGTGQVQVTINQSSSHISVPFFEMPVPIRLIGAGSQQMDVVLDNTSDGQTFTINVPFTVIDVIFDPEKNIISNNSEATLGTPVLDITEGIQMFPNPASNTIQIALPANVHLKSAVIYNMLGQELLQSSDATSLNISTLSSGVHFLTLNTNAGVRTLRFIKN